MESGFFYVIRFLFYYFLWNDEFDDLFVDDPFIGGGFLLLLKVSLPNRSIIS